jgi:hypothetical protein
MCYNYNENEAYYAGIECFSLHDILHVEFAKTEGLVNIKIVELTEEPQRMQK